VLHEIGNLSPSIMALAAAGGRQRGRTGLYWHFQRASARGEASRSQH